MTAKACFQMANEDEVLIACPRQAQGWAQANPTKTEIFVRMTKKGKYQSGQMGQTVNLLAYAFGGSNPSLPTPYYI